MSLPANQLFTSLARNFVHHAVAQLLSPVFASCFETSSVTKLRRGEQARPALCNYGGNAFALRLFASPRPVRPSGGHGESAPRAAGSVNGETHWRFGYWVDG
jgi:hypothetical protein